MFKKAKKIGFNQFNLDFLDKIFGLVQFARNTLRVNYLKLTIFKPPTSKHNFTNFGQVNGLFNFECGYHCSYMTFKNPAKAALLKGRILSKKKQHEHKHTVTVSQH